MRIRRTAYHLSCVVGLLALLVIPLAAVGQEGMGLANAAPAVPGNRQEEAAAGQDEARPALALEAGPLSGPAAALPWVFEVADDGHNINSIGTRSLAVDAAGRPHATYAGEHLYYAYRDGASWHAGIVTPDSASCPSMALDAAGRPHIAYYNQRQSSLDYARFDGSAWVTETVLQLSRYTLCPSLALDSGNVPHISVCPAYGGWHCYSLWYARREGTSWPIQVVREGSARMGGRTVLALNAADQPRIAFQQGGLAYGVYDGTAWSFGYLEQGDRDDLSLALDGTGQPHFLYSDNYGDTLHYARWDGSTWFTETVASGGGPGYYFALALDAAGRPRASYSNVDTGTLEYAADDGAGWYAVPITGTAAAANALALDPSGRPRLLNFAGNDLIYAYDDDAGWQNEPVEELVIRLVGTHTSIALDAAGRPHVSYRDNANADLKYAYRDNAGWHTQVVDGAGDTGTYTSLALDAAGRPHISYLGSGGNDLRYASFDGTAWTTTTVDVGGVGSYTSLALDSLGRPHVSYRNGAENQLRYARFDGTSWITDVLVADIPDYNVGLYNSIAVDTQDRPHVAYCNSWYFYKSAGCNLWYAYYDGAAWQFGFAGQEGYHASLALDSLDRPHIAHNLPVRAIGGTTVGYVPRYTYRTGLGEWSTTAVDTSTMHVSDISLALDAQDRPAIAYYEYDLVDLRYAYDDGTGWMTATVDSGGYVGAYVSLALDAAGYAHISYYDETGGDLKYAYQYCGPLEAVQIVGPAAQPLGVAALYTATYAPLTATLPVTVTWDNGSVGLTAFYTWDTTGTHSLAVTATNACGQVQGSFTVTVFCQPVEAVTAAGPARVSQGITATYTAAYTPVTASLPLDLDWDNGAAGPTASYLWNTTGTYTVALTATNDCGQAQDHLTVTVICQAPEEVGVRGPARVRIGQVAVYQAAVEPITASRPLSITWDNGAMGLSAAYSWTMTGTYTVTVTATNGCGQAQGAMVVEVAGTLPYTYVLPDLYRAYRCGPVWGIIMEGPRDLPAGEIGFYTATAAPPTATLPIHYRWDNGSTGPTAAYSWTVPGDYTIVVTATNPCGQLYRSYAVTIFLPVRE